MSLERNSLTRGQALRIQQLLLIIQPDGGEEEFGELYDVFDELNNPALDELHDAVHQLELAATRLSYLWWHSGTIPLA